MRPHRAIEHVAIGHGVVRLQVESRVELNKKLSFSDGK